MSPNWRACRSAGPYWWKRGISTERPHSRLELSAGFPPEKPASLEAALGRPLTPEFETKCLACHGAPAADKQAQAGVHCEACHGPAKAHLLAVSQGNPKAGVQDGSQSCTQCHNGFTPLADPLPEDLLISSQVTALQNSECFRQSAGAITCTQCHDPHRDASDLKARSEKACAQCHAVEASTKDRCLGCHVPNAVRGPFEMADHWIRVHPEQAAKSPHTVSPRSKLPVQHEYVRMMALETRAQAEEMRQRVQHGESFFELARDHSLDRTKVSGGYLGDLRLSEAKPALAGILRPLAPGEVSPAVENGGRFVIFQRFPRDFRWQANQIFEAAGRLRAEGKQAEAAKTYLKALEIYPRFLRALILLGSTLGEGGAPDRAAAALEFAAQLYPGDAGAQYNLGIAYDALKRPADAEKAYQRAIAIEPGLTPAFQNLAADLVEAGSLQEASEWIQKGLRENPLSAILYYNLATVREQLNDKPGAEQARKLAGVLDSRLSAR